MAPKKNKSQSSQVSYTSPNKRLRKEDPTNYLNVCLQDSGLSLKDPLEKHKARYETIQIIRNIKRILESNYEYPRNVGELYNDLQKVCQNMDIFRHYLFPNIVLSTGENSEELPINDSVIKILLSIPILQTKLSDFIFEKATDLAAQSRLEPWIQIIVRSFSSLDHIVDSEKIATNLINLLDITTEKMVKLKIITAIPDIIGDQYHNNIAMEISRLLSEDHDLIPAILDCLVYLCLSDEEHDHLQKQTLNILKSLSKCTYFPNFVKFLLMPGRLSESNCLAAVEGLRMALGWSTSTMNAQDIASSQVLTTAAIRNTIVSSKMTANTWLKVISQCKSSIEHKSIDFIILLILYSTSEDRQKQVENIIKKQVKLDILRNELIDEAFSKYKPILKEYLTHLLNLAKAFLRANGEVTIELFASHLYMLMFKELDDCCATIVAELLQYSFNSKQSISSILTILNYVFNINMSLLKQQSLQILSLLDRTDDMDLAEIRGVMNLLCGLAYGLENSSIKDDMHMIIRKELSSSNPKIKVQGILAGVHAVKYLMITHSLEDSEGDPENNSDAMCHLPEGNVKEAVQIIELICQSIKHFSDMTAFFYDELSKLVSNALHINKQFLSWLINAATNDWIQSFIVDSIEDEIINGITLTMQYGLNDDNEIIAINIAGLTLQHNAEVSINILSPLFQLVQTLHFKQNNCDLSSIDALLGCPIIIPQYDIDTVDELDQSAVSSILDCLIYSVNWFRELVNAFSTQDNDYLKAKTLKRVLHIEELQFNIAEVLSKCKNLSYKSPTAITNVNNYTRDLVARKTSKIIKHPINLKQRNSSDVMIAETMRSQATQGPVTAKNRLDVLDNISFRKFNINLLSLLKSKSSDKELNIKQANFILKSGNEILQDTMLSKIKKHTFLTKQENIVYDSKKALEYAENVNEILPTIVIQLKRITETLENKLSEIQSNDESEIIFNSELIDYIIGLEQIYTMLTIYYRWIGFKNNHSALLKKSLKTLTNPNNEKSSMKDLLLLVANEFKNHEKYCLLLSTAISLIELLNTIQNHCDSRNILLIVKSMAQNFLSRSWKKVDGSPEKGLVFNQNIDLLASIYFVNNEILDLKTMTLELAHDITLLKGKTDTLRNLKSINKNNFPIIFRNLGTAVFEATKKRVDKGMTNAEHLELWRDIAHILKSMTEIVKTHKSNSLSVFLKKSMPILKLFTSQGLPVLKLQFKNQTDEVLQILKLLQQSTRFLHSLCCHSRLKKNKALLSKVPYVKQILETLIYQVKAALAANDCSEAFWMGNLKNKDIHGEVIASQESIDDNSPDDGDIQLSDDEDCEDIDDELLNPESKSLSDII